MPLILLKQCVTLTMHYTVLLGLYTIPETLTPVPLGAHVFQAGYHPRKRTFKTHPKHVFSRYGIDLKYAFLHALFLNFSVLSFPKCEHDHVFAPKNEVRTYIS